MPARQMVDGGSVVFVSNSVIRYGMDALSIDFMHYNSVRIHQTLSVTPAMEAGVTERICSLEDVIRLVDEWAASQKVKP